MRRPLVVGSRHCIICGVYVRRPRGEEANNPPTWIDKYRILYRSRSSGTKVSGVATHANASGDPWYAPAEYHVSCVYNGNAEAPPKDELIAIMGVDVESADERYGFPFHEACWSLLEGVYGSRKVPWDTLFDVCTSMALVYHDRILDWGHDYEGILCDTRRRGAWSRSLDLSNQQPTFAHHDPSSALLPGDLPIERLHPPALSIIQTDNINPAADCFFSLPVDIRLLIAEALPMDQAFTLRLASKAFSFLFHDQSFWAGRFRNGNECGWMYGIRESLPSSPIDWRTLYKFDSQSDSLRPELRNRARIWRIASMIRDMTPLDAIESFSWPKMFGPAAEFDVWTKASSQLCDRHSHPFNQAGDHNQSILATQKAQLPGPLAELRVYFIKLGVLPCISGMTFVVQSGREIHLGYKIGRQDMITFLEDPVGFHLEVGPRALHNIQAVYRDESVSEWAGPLSGMPQTRRLVVYESITAVQAEFDGCTMVSFSVSRRCASSNIEAQEMKKRQDSLKHAGIWYPEMPPLHANLNQESAAIPIDIWDEDRKWMIQHYYPIYYTNFGGEKGHLLHHLSRVHGDLEGSWTFEYAGVDINSDIPQSKAWEAGPPANKQTLHVDGGQGERIAGATMKFECDRDDEENPRIFGQLRAVTMKTNHGKEVTFTTRDRRVHHPHSIEVTTAPGTTITGIYGRKEAGFVGFASETVSDS